MEGFITNTEVMKVLFKEPCEQSMNWKKEISAQMNGSVRFAFEGILCCLTAENLSFVDL